MKKQMLTTAAAVAAIAAAPVMAGEPMMVPAQAPSSSAITADITLGYHSEYAYRGVVISEDLNDDLLTLGLGLTYDDGSGNQLFADVYYRNVDAGGGSQQAFDDHTTVTLGARRELIPNLTGTLAYAYNSGGIYDGFGSDNADGHELQAKLDYAVTEDLVVYSLAAYDFGSDIDGAYYEAGAAYNYVVTDQVSIVASGALGYSDNYYGQFVNDDSGFGHFEVRLSAPVKVTEQLTVTPYVSYVDAQDIVSNAADQSAGALQDEAVIGGVEAVLTF